MYMIVNKLIIFLFFGSDRSSVNANLCLFVHSFVRLFVCLFDESLSTADKNNSLKYFVLLNDQVH